jgi:hypothetical protein
MHRTLDASLRHEAHANGRHVHINLGDAGPEALAALDQDAVCVCQPLVKLTCSFQHRMMEG